MTLKRENALSDLESINMDLFHDTTWIFKNDTTDLVFKEFTTPCLSGMVTIKLKPSGADITITEENNKEFVITITEYRTPCCLAKVFDEHELKLLPIGMSVINASKSSKDMPGPSKFISVSNRFTMKPKKCCHLVVCMRRIK
ncbi:hypothetical protein BS47DRAFT_1397829 [Hydnum rufescens UP504]|uniref:HECT domain-containing protein n=1 Tax=Hydnum rufescens UP504 TaxID=1448309 RepID=A0A9P6DSB5_9AGAM|nr:hypothetical protein BS47DRAFT_1397829 [Hydnum rufescens UP504]